MQGIFPNPLWPHQRSDSCVSVHLGKRPRCWLWPAGAGDRWSAECLWSGWRYFHRL